MLKVKKPVVIGIATGFFKQTLSMVVMVRLHQVSGCHDIILIRTSLYYALLSSFSLLTLLVPLFSTLQHVK